jgi:glycine oxidase
VRTPRGREAAGAVVVCAGCWTPSLAAELAPGAAPRIVPVRGQIVSLDAPRPAQAIVWGTDAYLVPKRDGSLVVGATAERVGFDCRVTADGVRVLLDAATRLLPQLAGAGFRGAWAGLRPDTPDHLPLVGPVPGLEGVVIAAGHYRNGVLLAPPTGRLVADGLLGKGWAEPAFAPARFRPGPG